MKLFVSDFPEETTAAQLSELFEGFGTVTGIRMRIGKKRRYAIVEMENTAEGLAAINNLACHRWQGHSLDVRESWW